MGDHLKVGDYVQMVVDQLDDGVISWKHPNAYSVYEVIFRNKGPVKLNFVDYVYRIVSRERAAGFCANCYRDYDEHAGGRCLYSFFRYRSIKEVY